MGAKLRSLKRNSRFGGLVIQAGDGVAPYADWRAALRGGLKTPYLRSRLRAWHRCVGLSKWMTGAYWGAWMLWIRVGVSESSSRDS